MSEPRIGRVLVASLHQGIAEVLPDRIEFYENWLSAEGLREGTIGLAPLMAVLSFLRGEGEAYDQATRRAGEHAADWTIRELPAMERRLIAMLPASLRARAALRAARALITATYPGSRAVIRVRRDSAAVDLRGSLFCEVRHSSPAPLCGYYAAAIVRVLAHFSIAADAALVACRSSGTQKGCAMTLSLGPPGAVQGDHA